MNEREMARKQGPIIYFRSPVFSSRKSGSDSSSECDGCSSFRTFGAQHRQRSNFIFFLRMRKWEHACELSIMYAKNASERGGSIREGEKEKKTHEFAWNIKVG